MNQPLPLPIVHTPARQLAQAIRERRVRAVDVVDAFLARIAQVNPHINALVQVTDGPVRAAAAQADAALARGEIWGPLHGVPFTVKDVIDSTGMVCAAGLPERATHVPATDAVVVERLRRAGAILLGRSNCPPGGGGGITDNPVYGATRNPHDRARSPGGSSGGEAAAIAAGLSPLGLGSDSGGSLRVPAHFCGIATLKPTSGRVPNTGVLNHPGGLSDPRSQIGPMARDVRDLALAFGLIAGPDGHDSGVVPMPLHAPASVDVGALRVAAYLDDGLQPTDPAVALAVQSAADVLARAGAALSWHRPKPLDEALSISQRWWDLDQASGADVVRLFEDWDRLRSAMLGFMAAQDLVLCPASAKPAPPLGQGGVEVFGHTLLYSLTGWPCVVLRAGTAAGGLPVGVQLVARPWHEHVALAAALQVELALSARWPAAAGG